MTDIIPPLGTLIQRTDGQWRADYLNRSVISPSLNRVLAYLRTIQLGENGAHDTDAIEQARNEYPYDNDCEINVHWAEAPKKVTTHESRSGDDQASVV
jgi:hypothetical protein